MRTIRLFSCVVPLVFAVAAACSSDDDEPGGSGSGATAGTGTAGVAGAGAGTGGDTGTAGTGNAATAGTGPGVAGAPGAGGTAGGVTGSGGTAGGEPIQLCLSYNEPCSASSECCSLFCNQDSALCDSRLAECLPADAACNNSLDCCNLSCTSGTCSATQCVSDNQPCSENAECCSGTCTDGACEALVTTTGCLTAGNSCNGNFDCCSGLCLDGLCELGSSFCVQVNDLCVRDADCCSAGCTIGANGVGTCDPVPTAPARCSGVEGQLCQDCNDCCSRLCVPYGPHGVTVCQPAQGCRIVGDVCREDSDCCGGSPDNGLPGAGNVTCDKESPDSPLGACRNPLSCSPQGTVCHYKPDVGDYPCSSSSAPNNCCGDPGGGQDTCQLDSLGVPRCYGITECVPLGEICSNSLDCCDDVPCVPWPDGNLRCGTPGDDPPGMCVPLDGPCTINADCCPPYLCIRPIGSTIGQCGNPPVIPPPPGGAGGQPPVITCAQYGQMCSADGDCCNDIPCTDGICKVPIG